MVIFNKFKKKYFPTQKNNFADYTIFDLSTSIPLIERFSLSNKVECNFSNLSEANNQSYDLVISNGAFSEMDKDLHEEYFEKVISNSKNGYFITNFDTHSILFNGWTIEEFVRRLNNAGKKNVQILDIKKYISNFEFEVGNKLIIFGENINIKPDRNNKIVLKLFKVIDLFQRISNKLSQVIINGGL